MHKLLQFTRLSRSLILAIEFQSCIYIIVKLDLKNDVQWCTKEDGGQCMEPELHYKLHPGRNKKKTLGYRSFTKEEAQIWSLTRWQNKDSQGRMNF